MATSRVHCLDAYSPPFLGSQAEEVERLLKISARVDVLWERHLEQRREVLRKTRRTLTLWEQADAARMPRTVRR